MSPATPLLSTIKSIQVDKWRDLEEQLQTYLSDQGRWVFRGQESSDWFLRTRIERELEGVSRQASITPYPEGLHGALAIGLRDRIELFVARAFQARASELMSRTPDKDDVLGLLSTMQHWGFPTRLLDVTASPYVALHFAIAPHFRGSTDQKTSAALYAFNSIFLRGRASRTIGSNEHVDFNRPDVFAQHFFREQTEQMFIVPVHPKKLDSRMAAQQGSFLVPSTIYEGFEKCLGMLDTADVPLVIKFILSDEVINQAQGKLIRMNIHEASLFPDIHGYARLVSDSIQAFKRVPAANLAVKLEALESFKWPG
jgi:hypothetical protein